MISKDALGHLPDHLRKALLTEYQSLMQNYLEGNWIPTLVGGGRFAEVVYTILEGNNRGTYAGKVEKPSDFVRACRALELDAGGSRSFQIMIPRTLPVLYEVRNNRDAGHVGGEVNSNYMDASAVVALCRWILAELVRVYHDLSTEDAQMVADSLAERTIPLFWTRTDVTRLLHSDLGLEKQILLLAANAKSSAAVNQLVKSTDYKDLKYFRKLLKKLHAERLIEYDEHNAVVTISPKGAKRADEIIAALALTKPS